MKKVQPIIFHVLSPFAYQNYKVVPWSYNATILVGGEEVQALNAEIVNIFGLRGMTRSGRVFAPKYTPKMVPTTVLAPHAGASICVPTTPVEIPDSSTTKDTSDNSVGTTNSKEIEVIAEKE